MLSLDKSVRYLVFAAFALAGQAQAQISDLGNFTAVGINEEGLVALNGPSGAFVFTPATRTQRSKYTLVPPAGAGETVTLSCINNLGQCSGQSNNHAFYFDGKKSVAKGDANTWGNGLNDSGEIAGRGFSAALGASYSIVWTLTGAFEPFGKPATGEIDGAQDIANSQTVVGFHFSDNNAFAYVYSGGVARSIVAGIARKISSANPADPYSREYVAGDYYTKVGGPRQGFVYDGTATHFLPLLGGTTASALCVNSHGVVVGTVTTAGGTRIAAIWKRYADGSWKGFDLNSLFKNSGWQLTSAVGINDSGQIVGSGIRGGVSHAFEINLPPLKVEITGLPSTMIPSVRHRYVAGAGSSQYNLTPVVVAKTATVSVTDPFGEMLNGAKSTVIADGNIAVGGHVGHSEEDIHGWLAATSEVKDDDGAVIANNGPVAPTALGGSSKMELLPLDATGSGKHAPGTTQFWYMPAEMSGADTILVNVTDPATGSTGSATYQLVIRGPQMIDMVGSYGSNRSLVFWGQNLQHPSNHWADSGAAEELSNAAQAYQKMQSTDPTLKTLIADLAALNYKGSHYDFPLNSPQSGLPICPKAPEPVFVNDVSLVGGGLFDVAADDAASMGHGGHRNGKQFDLKSLHLIAGTPYTVSNSQIAQIMDNPAPDNRLVMGTAPFVGWDKSTRAAMNTKVMQIHLRRMELLISSLQAVKGSSFAAEQTHIHVNLP